MPPSREQVAAALRKIDSATLRGKLITGELTAQAAAMAEEILAARERQVELEPDLHARAPSDADRVAPRPDLSAGLLGWSWGAWTVALVFSIGVVATFGTTTRNGHDQGFLYGVIFVQALALAGVFRTFASIFQSSFSLGIFGKLLALGVLLVVLAGLSVCSFFAQHGWQGG